MIETFSDWKKCEDRLIAISKKCGNEEATHELGSQMRLYQFWNSGQLLIGISGQQGFYIVGLKNQRYGRLYLIAVVPEERRKGIGRTLIDHALGTISTMGKSGLTFKTQANNIAAMKFYESLGATPNPAKENKDNNIELILPVKPKAEPGKRLIEHNYESPRWSMELPDCSMPMSMDTYSRCSFNCLYCFSFYQKSHCCNGYNEGIVRSVNPDKVRATFHNCMKGTPQTSAERQFTPYVQARKIMQWGGLADPFDMYEKKYGVTLDLLNFFDEIDYPLSFSTKSVWWTQDERYMEIFKRHTHNWHVKISIITLDRDKARGIEKGVPEPLERIAALKRLSDIGIKTTLRLRPFIIGVSNDWRELIRLSAEAGIISVSSEYFCLEARANESLIARYNSLSKVCGYNIYDFYRKNSVGSGYRRLSRKLKYITYSEMKSLCKLLGIRLCISDAHCRDLNEQCNCCGVPPEWNSQTANFQGAILKAKQNGKVTWDEIGADIEKFFGGFTWITACQFNTGNNRNRAVFWDTTMAGWLKYLWNTPERQNSPQGAYGGILRALGKDSKGNVTYTFNVGKKI